MMGYKRIYIGGSILTLFALFGVLMSLGLLISSDGDKQCSGTFLDPCISYISITNPTAKTVYVYNSDSLRLSFVPELREYKLYVKYYNSWRETNFTKDTRLPNVPKDAKYVFVFPAYSKKEFKLVGYKNRQWDIVKWTWNDSDSLTLLDPVWNVSGNITANLPDLEPDTAIYNTSLYCSVYANFSNASASNPMNVTFYYFENGIYQPVYDNQYGPIASNEGGAYSTKNVTETLVYGNNWTCKARYRTLNTNISTVYSSLYVSNYTTVNNSAPFVNLSLPLNNTLVDISISYPAVLKWGGSDPDNDTVTYKVYWITSIIVGTTYLINTTTSNSFNFLNATEPNTVYYWYVNASDGSKDMVTPIWQFNVSFMNWSITYSPNVSEFKIVPNASTGTFYPNNQSSTYGVFNVTNKESTVINLSVNLSGGLPRYIDLYFWNESINSYCYQESVNVSTSCGGLSTGNYGSSPSNVTDGNWSTFAVLSSDYYFNYSIPNNAVLNQSIIQIKVNLTTQNFSVPSTCGIINNKILFRYRLVVGYYLFCSKDGEWNNLNQTNINYYGSSSDFLNFYEEAMYWYMNNGTVVQKNSFNEKSYFYDRFNDSKTIKTNGTINATVINLSLQPMYKYGMLAWSTLWIEARLNLSMASNVSYVNLSINNTPYRNFSKNTIAHSYIYTLPYGNSLQNKTAAFVMNSTIYVSFINITNGITTGNSTVVNTVNATNYIFFGTNSLININSGGYSGGLGVVPSPTCPTSACMGYISCQATAGTGSGAGGYGEGNQVVVNGKCGGGGGASYNGSGTAGGSGGDANSEGGSAGSVYGTSLGDDIDVGSGGGGGGGDSDGQIGARELGMGGAGGGAVRLKAPVIEFHGNITANGGDGGTTTIGCGGGAGSGGAIMIEANYCNVTGANFYVNGGTGGGSAVYGSCTTVNSGGNGGTGRIKLKCQELYAGSVSWVYANTTNQTDFPIFVFNETIDFNNTLASFFSSCAERTSPAHTCSIPVRLELRNSNFTINNINVTMTAKFGTTNMTYITKIPAGSTVYIWSKAVYDNSPLGANFNLTWQATK
jgi:hypothetical protein